MTSQARSISTSTCKKIKQILTLVEVNIQWYVSCGSGYWPSLRGQYPLPHETYHWIFTETSKSIFVLLLLWLGKNTIKRWHCHHTQEQYWIVDLAAKPYRFKEHGTCIKERTFWKLIVWVKFRKFENFEKGYWPPVNIWRSISPDIFNHVTAPEPMSEQIDNISNNNTWYLIPSIRCYIIIQIIVFL